MRSRAAAEVLRDAGFGDVRSMAGGMRAWDGEVSTGGPEAGMSYFSDKTAPDELAALAWALEDGSQKFYEGVSGLFDDPEAVRLFGSLSRAEGMHKATLEGLYREFSGVEPGEGFPWSVLGPGPEESLMEGGVSVAEALSWAKTGGLKGVLELMMSLETNSEDLYVRMGRAVEDERAKKLFKSLAEEERRHTEKLAGIFGDMIKEA